MNRYFINAKLISLRRVVISLFSLIKFDNSEPFKLIIDNDEFPLKTIKYRSEDALHFYEVELPFDYTFGKQCYIFKPGFANFLIDNSNAIRFPEFDLLFNYHGNLGAIYSKNHTDFYLWAPLASSVFLKLENKDTSFSIYEMERIENGAYHLKINGDLNKRKYHYLVNNNGIVNEVNDPYAKGVSYNSEFSIILDLKPIFEKEKVLPKTTINNISDSIIYELNVRDFTEKLPFKYKGKFLGLIEENTDKDVIHPIGLDYLKLLGITHVQLLPILDFYNTDDKNTDYYNWGYDPISFFALEGSYSINPEDPYSRIEEFKKVVDTLHKNDIRVVMDVVYNHIYKIELSTLQKIVPGYYFRTRKDGGFANASGCGNDFASEKYMARRLILDSVEYLFKAFDIDGLRLDLMGLLDITTVNKINALVKNIKKDGIIYGEGWDMGYELPIEEKSCIANASKLKDIGFFNDTYRDVVKGASFKENLFIKGYLTGDLSYIYGMDYVIHGCLLNHLYQPKFLSASQSINYVECHDNYTLFDKLEISNKEEPIETRLKRIELINSILILSIGVPFIHMGQEIALSKHGEGNSYNISEVNNFDLSLYYDRFQMAESLSNVIKLRKKLKALSCNDVSKIKEEFECEHLDNGLYKFSNKVEGFDIVINPTLNELEMQLSKSKYLIYKNGFIKDNLINSSLNISPLTFIVLSNKEL